MKRLFCLTLACALLAALALPARAQYQAPDVLKQVPEKSAIVLVIPKLSDLDAKVGKFLKDFGGVPQDMHTPITAMLKEVGTSKGVDMNGSAALVMPTLQLMGEPRVYMILPIADATAFMTNFEMMAPSDKSPGVFTVPMGNAPEGYMKMTDGEKYVVLSDNEQVVAKQAPAEDAGKLVQQAGDLGRSVMAGSDAIWYVNMSRVGPILQPMAAMGLMQAQTQIENDPQAAAAMGGVEAAKVNLQALQQAVSTFLLQTDAVVIGGSVGDAGVTFNSAAQFKADSTPAQLFVKDKAAPLDLNRLPNRPYIFAAAMDNQAIEWQPIIKAVNEQLVAKMPEGSPMKGLIASYADAIATMDNFTYGQFAWFAGQAANPADILNMAYVYGADEPQSALGAYAEAMRKVAKAAAEAAEAAPEGVPTTTYTYHAADVEVNGKQVDRLEMRMNLPAEAMAMNPMAGMFAQPWNTYMTTTDDNVVMSLSGDTKLLEATLAAADGSGKLGESDEQLALSRKALPTDRFGEAYFDVTTMITFMTNMARGMGAPAPQVAVPDMPPLAIALRSKPGSVGLTYHAPTKLIHGVRDYTQAMIGAMMGGAMGGGMVQEAAEARPPAPAGVNPVTDAKFEEAVVKAPTLVLVEFAASWNADSRKQTPIMKSLAEDFEGDVAFMTLDTDENNEAAKTYKVRSIPTLLLFKDGEVVETFAGLTDEEKLGAALRKHMLDE